MGGGTKHFFLPILYNFKNIGDGLFLSNCCLTNQKGTEWQPGQLGIGEKFLGEGGGGGRATLLYVGRVIISSRNKILGGSLFFFYLN